MNKEREIERIEINMREARKMLKNQLDKFSKEIASDYRIKVPEDITEASKERRGSPSGFLDRRSCTSALDQA